MIRGDNKPEFHSQFADYVETWSVYPYFTLTKGISHALITTLTTTSSLILHLVSGDCNYVLDAWF